MALILLRFMLLLSLGLIAAAAEDRERVVESVLPALSSGPMCSSTVALQNLADRPVDVEVEAHKSSGALVPLTGHPEILIRLKPGELASYKLQIDEESTGAWIDVRERIPAARLKSVVSVAGKTDCVIGDQLRTSHRQVTYPTRNPWFAGDVGQLGGNIISMINTSEHAATAWLCYSTGGLYSVPGEARSSAELKPLCSASSVVQIAPFGSRQFPVERERSTYFSLKTEGDAIVLQMLRPVEASVRLYSVDSTVTFGGEVPEGARSNH